MKNIQFINKKHLLIALVTLIIIILIIVFFIKKPYKKNSENTSYSIVTSTDKKVSLSIPNTVSYKINDDENNDYILDLSSQEDDMYVYVSSIKKLHEIDFSSIVNDDRQSYMQNKQNIREDSGIYEGTINNTKSLEYHFVYFDENLSKDFYCNVVWIETSDNIYVFNFEVANDNMNMYGDIFSNMKNGISF